MDRQWTMQQIQQMQQMQQMQQLQQLQLYQQQQQQQQQQQHLYYQQQQLPYYQDAGMGYYGNNPQQQQYQGASTTHPVSMNDYQQLLLRQQYLQQQQQQPSRIQEQLLMQQGYGNPSSYYQYPGATLAATQAMGLPAGMDPASYYSYQTQLQQQQQQQPAIPDHTQAQYAKQQQQQQLQQHQLLQQQHQQQLIQQQQQQQTLPPKSTSTQKVEAVKAVTAVAAQEPPKKQWPEPLKRYVERVFKACGTDEKKKTIIGKLEQKIADLMTNGQFKYVDWDNEPLPHEIYEPVRNSPSPRAHEAMVRNHQLQNEAKQIASIPSSASSMMAKPNPTPSPPPATAATAASVPSIQSEIKPETPAKKQPQMEESRTLVDNKNGNNNSNGNNTESDAKPIQENKISAESSNASSLAITDSKKSDVSNQKLDGESGQQKNEYNDNMSEKKKKKKKNNTQAVLVQSDQLYVEDEQEKDSQALDLDKNEQEQREKRAKRFRAENEILQKTQQHISADPLSHDKAIAKAIRTADEYGIPIDIDAFVVQGTSTELEKPYIRLKHTPDPRTVRPQPILEKSLKMVFDKINEKPDLYSWASEQLKSIRQDMTVQRIKNDFSVKVYEANARLAIEHLDLSEYNQCQTQLWELYDLGLGDKSSRDEFLSYKIIYGVYTKHKYSQNSSSLVLELQSTSINELKSPAVTRALQIRSCVEQGSYVHFFRLMNNTPDNLKLQRSMCMVLVGYVRHLAIQAAAQSVRPNISIESLFKILQLGNGDDLDDLELQKTLKGLASQHGEGNATDIAIDTSKLGAMYRSKYVWPHDQAI